MIEHNVLVGLANEGAEGVVLEIRGLICPLHAVTFFRIPTMPAQSEDPSTLGLTASGTPAQGINQK